eukprot:jgi/Picre1/33375/NNA_008699.t1
MNSTGPKVQLKNDHLDKSLHMYLSNAKKKVPTPPLMQDQGKSSRSIQGNLEAFVMEYSKISSQPHTCRAAQRQLLDLIPEEAKGIFEEFHTTDEIHPSEVLRAIKQMNSTTAPGEDGIRLSVYAALKGVLAPFLAKLYTEMIQTGEAPANFFDGIIRPIPKGEVSPDPKKYRPITLLNVDYRIFTFVLKNRLTLPMSKLIPETQTAFLPGRHSAQNIWIQDAVPHLLAHENKWALVGLCDFQKAYDTIDRGFLLQICRELRMPGFLMAWIQGIMKHTRNRVYADNHISSYKLFHAGIRQGCPASPILYLLIGYMLHLLIDATDIGITLQCPYRVAKCHNGGRAFDACKPTTVTLKLSQYADDSKVFLGSQEQVKTFRACMDVFHQATGQRLNRDKTHLLAIGRIPSTLPRALEGFQLVTETKVLGITVHHGTAPPTVDWDSKLNSMATTAKVIKANRISCFGKFRLWNTFVISRILYAAEFTRVPQEVLREITKLTRELLPDNARCWSTTRMSAPPQEGGLGCLNFAAHTEARQAKWCLRLLRVGTSQLWSQLVWNAFLLHPHDAHIPSTQCLRECVLPPMTTIVEGQAYLVSISACIETIQANRTQPEQQTWYRDDYHWTLGQKAHPMKKYTVKLGTRLLSMEGQLERADAYYRWLYALCGATQAPGSPLIHQHLWKLPMDNKWKEPFWHASMGGFIRSSGSKPCACGMCETPDILHHFKHCPVAAAVYGQLSGESIHAEKVQFLVWTGTPPQHVPKSIWLFICVSAVYAIDRGRRYMYKLKYHTEGPVPQTDTIVSKGKSIAVQTFWNLLHLHAKKMPQGKPEYASLPIIAWNTNTNSWFPKPPPGVQLVGSIH